MIFAMLALVLSHWAYAGPDNPYAPQAKPANVQPHRSNQTTDPFVWKALPPVLYGSEQREVELRLMVPQGFVVYRDQLRVKVVQHGRLRVGKPQIPQGQMRLRSGYDVEARELYEGDVVVRLPVSAGALEPGLATIDVLVSHQGCHRGVCFRPSETLMRVHIPVRDQAPIPVRDEATQGDPSSTDAPNVPEPSIAPTHSLATPDPDSASNSRGRLIVVDGVLWGLE